MKGWKLLALMLCGIEPIAASWGSKVIDDKYRPKTGWIDAFHRTADVTVDANASIQAAIERCDEVVGKNRYCTVAIRGGLLGRPVEIFRSRTRLTAADSHPIRARKSGTMIYIGDGTRQVLIEGLKIEGRDVGNGEIYGIVVEGKKINKIVIRENEIYRFSTGRGDAHAIAVYGTGAGNSNAIRNVLISGNTIHDMRTGSSESIAINGNVLRWQISDNDLYDLNNIAIDLIGGEGTSPTRKDDEGRVLPGRTDAARYGFVEDNFVENLHTDDNPAYGKRESWAAAIYIDGGHHILVKDNVVQNAAWGYEIGAENCVKTRHIVMEGNRAEASYFGDLVVGGYQHTGYLADRSIVCDPEASDDADEGHGYVRNISIYENDFLSEETKEDRITIQYRTTHAIIEQEGVTPVNDGGNGSARGDQNAIRTHR